MEDQIWQLVNSSIYKLQGIRNELKRSRHFNEQCESLVKDTQQDLNNVVNLTTYEKKKNNRQQA